MKISTPARCTKHLKLFLLASLILLTNTNLFSQDRMVDSLKSVLRNSSDEKKIQVYQAIITSQWRSNPDTALVYGREAIRFAEQLNDSKSKALALRLYGGTYYYLGKYDSSLNYAKQAYKLSVAIGDSSLIASSQSNIGLNHIQMGNYPEALENLLESLSIKDRIDQKYALAITLNNIGLVYLKLKDYAKAQEFLIRAMDAANELDDEDAKLYASNNLGFTYLYTGKLDQAKKYFEESIIIGEKMNNLSWFAVAYSGLGQVYLTSNKPREARVYFNKALDLYTKINDKVGISEMYYLIGRVHAKKGDLDSAFFMVGLSKKSAEATMSRERRLDNFRLLEELYTQQKKYDSALFFKSRFMELHDSMFNESMMRTLSNIERKVSEEQAQRVLATKDILIQKKTIQTYYLVAIILIAVIFAFILYRAYRLLKNKTWELIRSKSEILQKANQLKEANEEINMKNEELEQQTEEIIAQRDSLALAQEVIESKNKELEETNLLLEGKVALRTGELNKANQDLRESNKELDHFIYRSSHDLKGPLARLLGLCQLGILETHEAQAKAYFEKLELTAHLMDDMLMKLINIHEIHLKSLDEVPVNLKTKVMDSFNKTITKLQGSGLVHLINSVNEAITPNTDVGLIENLFGVLMENSIQYRDTRKDKNFLIVTADCPDQSHVRIVFADNGVGIPEELSKHIFDMFVVGGNGRKGGHGLGLYEARIIVKKLKGEIALRNSLSNLTEFEVTLPLQGR